VIKAVLLSLLLLLPSAPKADWVANPKSSLDFVIASKQACPESIQKLITEEYRPLFHLAKGRFNDINYIGCWAVNEGIVYLIWEDGKTGSFRESQFREMKEI
jgi:hypothetical protein